MFTVKTNLPVLNDDCKPIQRKAHVGVVINHEQYGIRIVLDHEIDSPNPDILIEAYEGRWRLFIHPYEDADPHGRGTERPNRVGGEH